MIYLKQEIEGDIFDKKLEANEFEKIVGDLLGSYYIIVYVVDPIANCIHLSEHFVCTIVYLIRKLLHENILCGTLFAN